uniref:Uncharacterized protein n=1 Tax=Arundo donax TaxID=35708 RepID=A0A0A9DYH3_ARUDO
MIFQSRCSMLPLNVKQRVISYSQIWVRAWACGQELSMVQLVFQRFSGCVMPTSRLMIQDYG